MYTNGAKVVGNKYSTSVILKSARLYECDRIRVRRSTLISQQVPFSVPHVSSADDWYEGVLIPKGTICLQNMRMTNSEMDVFVFGAAQFNPARYRELLGQGARRQGGGTHVVWVWAAHMLWEIRCGGHVGDRLVDAGLDDVIRAS